MVRNRYYFIIPTLWIFLWYLSILVLDSEAIDFLAKEDHVAEWMSFFALLGTSLVFLTTFFRMRNHTPPNPPIAQLSLIVLAFMFFVAAGEEISWGQRIIGFETPEGLRELNEQGEFNFHNLPFLDQRNKLLIDHYDLINIVWFVLVIAIPLTASSSQRMYERVSRIVVIAPYSLGILFILNYVLGKIYKFILPKTITINYRIANINEIREMLFAVLFLTVAIHIYFNLVRPKKGDAIPHSTQNKQAQKPGTEQPLGSSGS